MGFPYEARGDRWKVSRASELGGFVTAHLAHFKKCRANDDEATA